MEAFNILPVMAPTKVEPIRITIETKQSLADELNLKSSCCLNNQQPSNNLCCNEIPYKLSGHEIVSLPTRKSMKKETIVTRIYKCLQDFKPIKITQEN